jgi:hypothetical protein
LDEGNPVKAQEYLSQLKASYHFFHDLMEIALLPYKGPEADTSYLHGREDIPSYVRDIVDRALAKYGSSLSADDLDYARANAGRAITGLDSELEWPRMIHKEFLERASDEGRKLLTVERDVVVGELQTADFNGAAMEVPGAENLWVVALNDVCEFSYTVSC